MSGGKIMDIQGWMIWFIIAAIFIIAEIFTAGFFIFWFGIGAAAAGVLGILHVSVGWQWLAFGGVSFLLFLISRPFAKRITKDQPEGIGANRAVGQNGIVLEPVDNNKNTGRVRIGKDEWRANSESDDVIPKGTKVTVRRVDGTHLIVKRQNQGG
jgi:membrane protein implicated in regulation of membrane protease activity